MTMKAATLTAILMATLVSAVSHAQDFSADVVYLEISKVHGRVSDSAKEARHSSKLYVSKGNIRLETNGLTGAVLVVNKEEHTAVALYPGKKSYQPLGSGPSQYFRVENADDACADWQRTAEQKIVCERVGPEMVNGREAVKYQTLYLLYRQHVLDLIYLAAHLRAIRVFHRFVKAMEAKRTRLRNPVRFWASRVRWKPASPRRRASRSVHLPEAT